MILDRLKEYIDQNRLTVASFEKSIGMSNASFGKSLKNKGAIGSDKLENILRVYPDISAEWLLTGKGEMLKSKEFQTNSQSIRGNSNNMIGGNGSISLEDDNKSHSISEYSERLKKQEEYIERLLEEQRSLHQQISKLIDKLK